MPEQEIELYNNPSIGFERVVDICNGVLRELFGAYGFSEISLEDFLYDHDLEEWKIKFKREINEHVQWWELCLDMETGNPTSFRRLRDEE